MRKEKYGKRTIYKNDWFEFCSGWKKLNFRVSPASYFDNRAQISFSFGWGQFYISIPFIKSKYDECDPPQYGFYFYSVNNFWPTTFVWCWGKKTKHFDFPWYYDWVRTSRLLNDNTWVHDTYSNRKKGKYFDLYKKEIQENLWCETYSYMYKLKNGEIQIRNAKITIEEREWRPKWFKWTKLFRKVNKSIDIEFDREVGERSGTWKGGVLGCSWTMLPNETAFQCLKRMERDRKM